MCFKIEIVHIFFVIYFTTDDFHPSARNFEFPKMKHTILIWEIYISFWEYIFLFVMYSFHIWERFSQVDLGVIYILDWVNSACAYIAGSAEFKWPVKGR